MDAVSRSLEVVAGIRVMRVDLALPSGRTFVTLALRGPRRQQHRRRDRPRVRCRHRQPAAAMASVVVRWARCNSRRRRHACQRQTVTRFGDDGRYVACGVPTGAPVLISARAGAGDALTARGVSSEIELSFTPTRLRCCTRTCSSRCARRQPPRRPARRRHRSAVPSHRTGNARLTGRVTSADGAPVLGARVQVMTPTSPPPPTATVRSALPACRPVPVRWKSRRSGTRLRARRRTCALIAM